jgi:alkanesulfonate monooxygenase SsuD/methylene tetrahydromethanopterin reductase-like flavin-dependent oxidoreductase (luciferase family)
MPHGAICVWAVTAETPAEAARLFSSREISRLNRDRGIYAALPSPEEAEALVLSDAEKARVERIRSRSIYGTPDVVGAKLRALSEQFQVEEIAILTTVHDPEARRRSYALLAEEFGMQG